MPAKKILVSDFDGTITRHDFYRLVLERLIPKTNGPAAVDEWNAYREGRLTHFEALNAIFQRAEGGESLLLQTAMAMEPDPALADEVRSLKERGWTVVVASAGCRWYIDVLLKAAKLDLEVFANRGSIVDGRLVMVREPHSPVDSFETGIDKAAVVRLARSKADVVAFAGDGYPDLAASLLVAPHHRFATGALADELTKRNEPFRRFERWRDIAQALLEETDSKL